jgi:hypothetical protein
MAGIFCKTLGHKDRGKNKFYTLLPDLGEDEEESSQVASRDLVST